MINININHIDCVGRSKFIKTFHLLSCMKLNFWKHGTNLNYKKKKKNSKSTRIWMLLPNANQWKSLRIFITLPNMDIYILEYSQIHRVDREIPYAQWNPWGLWIPWCCPTLPYEKKKKKLWILREETLLGVLKILQENFVFTRTSYFSQEREILGVQIFSCRRKYQKSFLSCQCKDCILLQKQDRFCNL